MSSQKTHDLVMKTGEYTDRSGATRARTKNVGALYQREDGSMFLMLDSMIVTMEAQYLCNSKREDRVMLSAYAPRDEKPASSTPPPQPAQKTQAKSAEVKTPPRVDFDDEIPF